jgi:ABC-type thiamin/hydroxymethylpyrimidine transport system permease subunit
MTDTEGKILVGAVAGWLVWAVILYLLIRSAAAAAVSRLVARADAALKAMQNQMQARDQALVQMRAQTALLLEIAEKQGVSAEELGAIVDSTGLSLK